MIGVAMTPAAIAARLSRFDVVHVRQALQQAGATSA
jgi:hypothetical protein